MKISRWTGKLGLVAAGAFLACSTASAERYDIRWVLVHEPSKVVEEAAKDFSARVDKRTAGVVRVEVLSRSAYRAKYNKGQPVSQKSAMEDVNSGKLEMCQAYSHSLGNYASKLWVLDMPFLFRDYDHAEKVIESSIGRRIRKQLEDGSNMTALAITYSGGKGAFALRNREVRRPQDLKGLRIMIANTPVFRGIAHELGLESIVVPPEGFVSLAERDLVDGIEITPARFDELQLQRQAKVIVNTDHFMLTSMVVMNKRFFKSLPERYQTVIQEEITSMARMERLKSIEANRAALAKVQREGVKVIDLSDDQKKAFRQALAAVYDNVDRQVGRGFIAAIQNTASGPVTAQR